MDEKELFAKAGKDFLEAVIFENWLRFYFMDQETGNEDIVPHIHIPEKELAQIARNSPRFLKMANELNDQTVDFEKSRGALYNYIYSWLQSEGQEISFAEKVLTDKNFQQNVDSFQNWLQMHASHLPSLDEKAWFAMFEQWKSQQKSS